MRSIRKLGSIVFFFISISRADGLPIGFGHNQGGLEYQELKTKNFTIYHDARTPKEAQVVAASMEAAKPHIEHWLGVKRPRPLHIVTTALGNGASFANFVTDAIELQTSGLGTRDLAWHELTHTLMYQHLDNWFGHAGAIIHLIWLPTWFLEGLAESFSVSAGSDIQAGFERYHALSGRWPSYERLHSLYNDGATARQGYAVSGAFVSYILQKYGSDFLPRVLSTFYKNSMPWWWPWAAFPYGPFLPFDDALKQVVGRNGRELYEDYKAEATKYWESHRKGEFVSKKNGDRINYESLPQFETDENGVSISDADNGTLTRELLKFNKDGWVDDSKTTHVYPDDADYYAFAQTEKTEVYVREAEFNGALTTAYSIDAYDRKEDEFYTLVVRKAPPEHLFLTKNTLSWIEHSGQSRSLCSIPRSAVASRKVAEKDIVCATSIQQPRIAEYLGQQKSKGITESIWLGISRQTLRGDENEILVWRPDLDTPFTRLNFANRGTPISAAFTAGQTWLLVGEHNRRTLVRIDEKASCQGIVYLEDTGVAIRGIKDEGLAIALIAGKKVHIARLSKEDLKEKSCEGLGRPPISPLLVAMREGREIDIKKALAEANIRKDDTTTPPFDVSKSKSADEESTLVGSSPKSEKAKWRGHPLFAVPWIGGDAKGYNFGVLSVPLMDEMQNETVRFTTLVGIDSKYPGTYLTLTSTRFWPTLELEAFRDQVWSSLYIDENGLLQKMYTDEKGAVASASFYLARWSTAFTLGMKASFISPYIGPTSRHGRLTETLASLSKGGSVFGMSWSLGVFGRSAPESMNENFDYNVLGFGADLSDSYTFLSRDSTLRLGLTTSRTRGKKRRELKEFYQPLKTFIPGGGGSGYNNVNFPIVENGGLFSSSFGDTMARSSASYTIPVIADLDTLVRLFYLQSLDLTAFLNYGGAWYGEKPTSDDLIAAHGYNLDLHFDLKGVDFNVGLGTGQVFGQPFDVYSTFSFEAIF